MNLEIECKGITNVTPRGNYIIDVELEGVDLGFLTDIEPKDIIRNVGYDGILEAMDKDDIIEWLLQNYDLEIIEGK